MSRGMAEVVKEMKYNPSGRMILQAMIDNGRYRPTGDAIGYFYGRPPYQYTIAETSNFMDGGYDKKGE